MLRRVRKAYDGEASQGVGITDYLNFYQVKREIVEWLQNWISVLVNAVFWHYITSPYCFGKSM